MRDDGLPLRYVTPQRWAAAVLSEPLALLNDHAHLEKKAAANALELLNRWPEPRPPENWVTAMTAVARDEVEHLATVTRLLARRATQPTAWEPLRERAAQAGPQGTGAGGADRSADDFVIDRSALVRALQAAGRGVRRPGAGEAL